MLTNLVNKTLSFLVLATLVLIIYIILVKLFRKDNDPVLRFFARTPLLFIFLVSASATLGSLFYSEIAGYTPCKLCWLQRIFMYPTAFLSGLALIKNDKRIIPYLLGLNSIGIIFSLYHNYIYFTGQEILSCDAAGSSVSCLSQYVTELDFITIPFMALAAFSAIILLSLIGRQKQLSSLPLN